MPQGKPSEVRRVSKGKLRFELNADVGEIDSHIDSGVQDALLALVHRANVACGGHAGDERTMQLTVAQCLRRSVLVGAHPSYPDKARFGRVSMTLSRSALAVSLAAQVDALDAVCRAAGTQLHHIKPHGALYHDAARDPATADVVLELCRARALPVIGALDARTRPRFVAAGIAYLDEVFADRAYRDGALVPRGEAGALLDDPLAAVAQIKRFWGTNAKTVCVHGDSSHALQIARAISELLANEALSS